jgi:hypothetical protein
MAGGAAWTAPPQINPTPATAASARKLFIPTPFSDFREA